MRVSMWTVPIPDSELLAKIDSKTTCPKPHLLYQSLEYFRPEDTRVVILGQDPYHTPGKANGLAFGFNQQYTGKIDSSMYNIIRELDLDPKRVSKRFLSLKSWAEQGVLLLNTRLSVRAGKPMSHAGMGWEEITAEILKQVPDHVPYLCFGREALLVSIACGVPDWRRLYVSHPCRYSVFAGKNPFRGSRVFDECNEKYHAGIDWRRNAYTE